MGPRRFGYLLLGVAALVAAALAATRAGVLGWLLAVVFLVAPDLTFLIGMGTPVRQGQLPPAAVPWYNSAHRLYGALVLLALGAVLALVTGRFALLAAGLAWLAHLGVDRALGFGLRTPDGFQRA